MMMMMYLQTLQQQMRSDWNTGANMLIFPSQRPYRFSDNNKI
jgi:hypothetical protein